MIKDAAYWITLAHMPGWGYLKTNNLIVKFHHEKGLSIADFFKLDKLSWKEEFSIEEKDIDDLENAGKEIPGNSFLAESMESQGYEIIPITSPEYSKILKDNLKISKAPPVLYIKGDKSILSERSVAIVGSRTAGNLSLMFTDNIARKASSEFKVVVSGFAKGVDKQALDSAIKHRGKSIIVLPQGIMTFSSGFKTYYKDIQEGNVLVLSTFFPKAPWKVELAMARNSIIYGLAAEIYVAESNSSGGTWQGAINGIKAGRPVFIRMPEPGENNANLQLIKSGALAVNYEGEPVNESNILHSPEKTTNEDENNNIDKIIISMFNGRSLSAKEINDKLNLKWTAQKLSKYLRNMEAIKVLSRKKNGSTQYALKNEMLSGQTDLFKPNSNN
jgi:predicted Rossmann fold nucleotide-binding protein DprA/Smf involved in DNA uptake